VNILAPASSVEATAASKPSSSRQQHRGHGAEAAPDHPGVPLHPAAEQHQRDGSQHDTQPVLDQPQLDDKDSKASASGRRADSSSKVQQEPHEVLEQKLQEQLHKLGLNRVVEDVTSNLADKLRKHYHGDVLAQHVVNKSRLQPASSEISYFVDAQGLVRFSRGEANLTDPTAMPLYVPKTLRSSVLHAFHGLPMLGHQSVAGIWPLLRRKFHWPGITRDLRRWIQACLCCRRRKASRNKLHGLSSPMTRAAKPFHTIHFDLVGPFDETARGNVYILTAMCPFVQFPFAVGIPNKEAETVARALVEIFALVGPPEEIVSDRAAEFTGLVMQAVCRVLNIKHIRTSGYQPQGNQVERFHRFLVAALCIHCHEFRDGWDDALPLILFAFRASVSSTTGYSPFFLTYGREAPLPVDALFQLNSQGVSSLPDYAERLQQTLVNVYKDVAKTQMAALERNRVTRDNNEGRVDVKYQPGESVLVWGPVTAGAPYRKSKLLYQWSKPKVIKEKVSDIHYRLLERVEGKHHTSYRTTEPIHVNRLRPYVPLSDGTPSVQNQPPPPRVTWQQPSREPKVGDLVVVQTSSQDSSRKFDVGRVLEVVHDRKRRFILHWYGNARDDSQGAHKPCFVDQRDNKRLYKHCTGARYSPWTSATNKTTITVDNILLIDVELTKAGKLSADDMERIKTCPHLDWQESPEEPSFFRD